MKAPLAHGRSLRLNADFIVRIPRYFSDIEDLKTELKRISLSHNGSDQLHSATETKEHFRQLFLVCCKARMERMAEELREEEAEWGWS